jgi:hypothetical protein
MNVDNHIPDISFLSYLEYPFVVLILESLIIDGVINVKWTTAGNDSFQGE